jgi:hypothetical protein
MGSEIYAPLVDAIIFRRCLVAAREARIDAARIVAESQALRVKSQASRAEANEIVEHSRALAIQFRASDVRRGSSQLPSPRKMRSLYVQSRHECDRFLRLATEVTEVIEHCAENVANSAAFSAWDRKNSLIIHRRQGTRVTGDG